MSCVPWSQSTFGYIPLLELNIPNEFGLSDSSKTLPCPSCKLRVESWLRLDNLTDFYCRIFFVLNFIFHFSIFTCSIKTLFHISDVKGVEIFITRDFFSKGFYLRSVNLLEYFYARRLFFNPVPVSISPIHTTQFEHDSVAIHDCDVVVRDSITIWEFKSPSKVLVNCVYFDNLQASSSVVLGGFLDQVNKTKSALTIFEHLRSCSGDFWII